MKFSISLPTCFEGVMYPIPFVAPGDFVRLAQLCERLGYDSVWGNDHITSQHYVRELFPDSAPNFYEVMTVLSFCAAATTRIRVGTALAVLPMRDPFWLAKQAATLDQLSDGRLVLALGVGAYREEFAAWAPRVAAKGRRGEMMDEGIELMRRLFSERRVTHDGKYYAVRDIEMYPKPKRDPFALWIGGHNLETVERTARVATGWLPGWRPWPELAERIDRLKARAAGLGRDPAEIEIAPQFSLTIAFAVADHLRHVSSRGQTLVDPDAMRLDGERSDERVSEQSGTGDDHRMRWQFPALLDAPLNSKWSFHAGGLRSSFGLIHLFDSFD